MQYRILAPFLLFCSAILSAAPRQSMSDPVTQAAVREYTELIRENPRNYHALFGRGNEYYQHDDYVRALDDFTEALKYAPAKGDDEATRLQLLIFRADIYNQTKRPEDALKDLTEAYALAPDSYTVIYQKANTEYVLGRYADANTDYKRLAQLNPRSVESLVGQARIAVKHNNLGIANELLARAVAINPNNGDTFVRRASVRKMMGDHNGAVDDLILAISTDDPRPNDALKELVEYGNTNYAATIAGLTNAMAAAPQNGMFPYLRAMIAQAHYNYTAAVEDYRLIIDQGLYNYHGIYASLAECLYALGRYTEALDNIDHALGMIRGNAAYFAVRSSILRALGRDEGARTAAEAGLIVDPANVPCLEALALARTAVKDYAGASTSLGEAVMNDPEAPKPLLLRAWLAETYLNAPTAARGYLEQVSAMDHFYLDNVRSLKGFALLRLGDKEKALQWIKNILDTADDPDGLADYYATCLYAQAGEPDKALECMERALEKGFADYHAWMDEKDGWLIPGSLRDELRFLNLINRYAIIFGR